MEEHRPGIELEEGWILVCKNTEGGDKLVPVESPETITRQQQLFGYDHKPCSVWEEVVNVENALYMGSKPKIAESDDAAVQKLRLEYLLLKKMCCGLNYLSWSNKLLLIYIVTGVFVMLSMDFNWD